MRRFARLSWPFVLTSLVAAACAVDPSADLASPDDDEPQSEEDLFAGMREGKYDSAGHPLNARVTEAEMLCSGAGRVGRSSIALSSACSGTLASSSVTGEFTVNTRVRVRAFDDDGSDSPIMTVRITGGYEPQEIVVRPSTLVGRNRWLDLSTNVYGRGDTLQFELVPAPGAAIVADYIELFPRNIGAVIGPGAGVLSDSDRITIDTGRNDNVFRLDIDGVEQTTLWRQALARGAITKTVTDFRSVWTVRISDLVPTRGDVTQLRVFAGNTAAPSVATTEIRKTVVHCNFVGTGSKKVLLTGFQPFPADGKHENVSAVAVGAAQLANMPGAKVMKVILPVEYDRAAASVVDIIARCAPDVVISFGQGRSAIDLEQTAYNLKDAAQFPDNRGIELQRVPIDAAGQSTVASSLPLQTIAASLQQIGEAPQRSDDPGRYICNNVFYREAVAMAARGGIAGFVHLPYTTRFPASVPERFGKIVETIVNASVAAR